MSILFTCGACDYALCHQTLLGHSCSPLDSVGETLFPDAGADTSSFAKRKAAMLPLHSGPFIGYRCRTFHLVYTLLFSPAANSTPHLVCSCDCLFPLIWLTRKLLLDCRFWIDGRSCGLVYCYWIGTSTLYDSTFHSFTNWFMLVSRTVQYHTWPFGSPIQPALQTSWLHSTTPHVCTFPTTSTKFWWHD